MRCSFCTKPITATQRKQVKIDRDANGKPKGVLHNKCFYVRDKHSPQGTHIWGDKERARYSPTAPTAYDMATGKGVKRQEDSEDEHEALAARQAEIAEQEELEKRPSQWADWREPGSVDI